MTPTEQRKQTAIEVGKSAISRWFEERNISSGIQTAPMVYAFEKVAEYYESLLGEQLDD